MKKPEVHYGWVILFTSFLVVAGALGIGRFSYGMLLPSLQEGMNLTHREAGFIASANMLGYFLAALLVGGLVVRYGPRAVASLSLLGVGVSMMAIGSAWGFVPVLLLRFLTGLCSAGGNITVMGLSATWVDKKYRGLANGFLVGGSGVAMLLAGRLVPLVMAVYPEEGWRFNWYLLGSIVLAVSLVAWALIRNQPQQKGLGMLGGGSAPENGPGGRVFGVKDILKLKQVRIIAVSYYCFGMSYMIYTTFFVNYLVGEKGLTQGAAGDIWGVVGILSIGSALIWGSLSDMIGRPHALSIVFLLQGSSYLVAALAPGLGFMWLSAVIFGLTAWSIPGIMASYCGDLLGPRNATTFLGLITLFFSMGSIFGPVSGGYVKDISGSFAGALCLATAIALLGGVLSVIQVKGKGLDHRCPS